MPDHPRVPAAARDAILAWYAERGRPFAFRETGDPYAILVSEAMAQQTQVARAAAYWERFMERFPTIESLAATTPADVLRVWAGLGYDRRALALWRAARIVVAEHGGRIPATLRELEALPGVGPYTARAVAALAFGQPVGAVDVNVRRVLGRIVAGSAEALPGRVIQLVADDAVPADAPGRWTHAVMDVGATLCRPRAPRCGECPAMRSCRYARHRSAVPAQDAAPGPRPRVGATRERAAPFTSTDRWLRGRILDRLRASPDGVWVRLDGGIGEHDHDRVQAAAHALARDGLVEIDAPTGSDRGAVRARLALS